MEWLTPDMMVGFCIGIIIGLVFNWHNFDKMVYLYQDELMKMARIITELQNALDAEHRKDE